MPELPEVESVRLGLEKMIVGQKVLKTTVLYPKIVASSGNKREEDIEKTSEFIIQTTDRRIRAVNRRAKNIIIQFEGKSGVLVHLKMTGQLVYVPYCSTDLKICGGHPIQLSDEKLPNKHTAVIFELEAGHLYFNDTRKFGHMLFFNDTSQILQQKNFQDFGFEPLGDDFTLEKFQKALQNKKTNLKKMFLDQKVVVGLGNIYADEVCFAAKVRPDRMVNTLTQKEIKNLFEEIKRILKLAVSLGGSSVANYLLADGSRGNYAHYHKVYGKSGKECEICKNHLTSIKLAGRTTVFCEHCQK